MLSRSVPRLLRHSEARRPPRPITTARVRVRALSQQGSKFEELNFGPGSGLRRDGLRWAARRPATVTRVLDRSDVRADFPNTNDSSRIVRSGLLSWSRPLVLSGGSPGQPVFKVVRCLTHSPRPEAPLHSTSKASDADRESWARAQLGENWEKLLPQLERLSRRADVSYGALLFGAIVIISGSTFIILNWGSVRSHVSRESAEVVAETIKDDKLRYNAQMFSKELLDQLLTDEDVKQNVARWTLGILDSIKNEIGNLFVHILALQPVVDAVNRLADRLVEYLCGNRVIQERVGKLLVDAICLESSRNAAAHWAYDLVKREDVVNGFRDLVVTALQTDGVVQEARSLAIQIVNSVLNDAQTQNEAKRALNETLRDSELRATAKDSLWSVLMPWGSSAKVPDKKTQSALRSLDEVMANESLTEEEKQMLRAVQMRMRDSSNSANGKNGSTPTVASIPTAAAAASAASPAKHEGTVATVSPEEVVSARTSTSNAELAAEPNSSTSISEASSKDGNPEVVTQPVERELQSKEPEPKVIDTPAASAPAVDRPQPGFNQEIPLSPISTDDTPSLPSVLEPGELATSVPVENQSQNEKVAEDSPEKIKSPVETPTRVAVSEPVIIDREQAAHQEELEGNVPTKEN